MGHDARTPFFSPQSVFWRVNREAACGLAAPRAVLMQIAHPLVAAGVAEHSQFRTHRFARLYRTAFAATAITFGSRQFATRAWKTVDQKHRKVRGALRTDAGIFPAGTRYDANDPYLKLWVLSTITDSALLAYDLFVTPLSFEDRCRYYEDSLIAADIFGIPPRIMPDTYADFREYMAVMLNDGPIQVSEDAKAIARTLFARSPSGALLLAGSSMGICLLPDRLRRDFGLDWGIRPKLRWVPTVARAIRKVTPTVLCANPAATASEFSLWWRQWRHGEETVIESHERP